MRPAGSRAPGVRQPNGRRALDTLTAPGLRAPPGLAEQCSRLCSRSEASAHERLRLTLPLPQAAAVVRLEGGGQADAETLGPAVWAADAAGVFWPGEALDPFRLPRTRALPAGAAAGASRAITRLTPWGATCLKPWLLP